VSKKRPPPTLCDLLAPHVPRDVRLRGEAYADEGHVDVYYCNLDEIAVEPQIDALGSADPAIAAGNDFAVEAFVRGGRDRGYHVIIDIDESDDVDVDDAFDAFDAFDDFGDGYGFEAGEAFGDPDRGYAAQLALDCSCPAFANHGPCKHLWAVAVAVDRSRRTVASAAPVAGWAQWLAILRGAIGDHERAERRAPPFDGRLRYLIDPDAIRSGAPAWGSRSTTMGSRVKS